MALTKVTGEGVGTLSSSGATTATFNRTTSDGTVIDVQKSGTTVGSIQTKDSRLFINGSQGSTPAGIYFGGGGDVLPASTTNAVDNSISLGGTGHRFKDLYLSGGVYLGGTGSANYLQDYEIGTWTPSVLDTDGNAGGTSVAVGNYTKVGRLVTLNGIVVVNSQGSASSSLGIEIGNLPFTISNILSATSIEASGSVSFFNSFATGVSFITISAIDDNKLALHGFTSNTQTTIQHLTWSIVGSNSWGIRFTIAYNSN